MKTIQIEIPDGKKAEWVDGVLTLVDDKPKDITERIKTFEDACEWCTKNGHFELRREYDCIVTDTLILDEASKDLVAYLKLRIIVAALNEGWEPQFTEDEYRCYPWFYLYTEKELARKSDEWKKKNTIIPLDSRLVGRSYNSANANGGLVYASASVASSDSDMYNGSRLAFKSEELAIYAGKQFIEIYADMMLS